MADKKNKMSLFWTSYSDLMTSLFFTMLVLFVVVVVAMGKAQYELREEKEKVEAKNDSITDVNKKLEAIMRLSEQFQALTRNGSLAYDEEKCIFYAKDLQGIEIFFPNKDQIDPKYDATVEKVGKEIKTVIDSLNNHGNFKFQLVIEGTAAIKSEKLMAKTYNPDDSTMYVLSYKRALALYYRWKDSGFIDRMKNTEIIIGGSGFNGINRDEKNEDNNKRFVIQIIPKIERPVD